MTDLSEPQKLHDCVIWLRDAVTEAPEDRLGAILLKALDLALQHDDHELRSLDNFRAGGVWSCPACGWRAALETAIAEAQLPFEVGRTADAWPYRRFATEEAASEYIARLPDHLLGTYYLDGPEED